MHTRLCCIALKELEFSDKDLRKTGKLSFCLMEDITTILLREKRDYLRFLQFFLGG